MSVCVRDDHILLFRVIHAVIQAKLIILIWGVLSGLHHLAFFSVVQIEHKAVNSRQNCMQVCKCLKAYQSNSEIKHNRMC